MASGEYIVNGLGHCGECHTPRAITLQLEATTSESGSAYLSGSVIENYFAPSLRRGGPGTLRDWSVDELAKFLKTGASAKGVAFGSMSEVVTHSTQFMKDADLLAVAKYLQSLRERDFRRATAFVYDPATHNALRSGDANMPGAMANLDNCAARHRPDGMGYEDVFPRLAGNAVVLTRNPLSLISIILPGRPRRGHQAPRRGSRCRDSPAGYRIRTWPMS